MAEILEVELYAEATTQEEWLEKISEAERPFSGLESIGGEGKFEGNRGFFYSRFLLPVSSAQIITDERL